MYDMDTRDRIRDKQDRILELAERLHLDDSLQLSDGFPGSPRIYQLHGVIFPEWEAAIDAALRSLEARTQPDEEPPTMQTTITEQPSKEPTCYTCHDTGLTSSRYYCPECDAGRVRYVDRYMRETDPEMRAHMHQQIRETMYPEAFDHLPPAIPCDHPADAVKWNPYNQVTQCHMCGQVFPTPDDHATRDAAQRADEAETICPTCQETKPAQLSECLVCLGMTSPPTPTLAQRLALALDDGTPEGDAARWLANRGLAPMAGGSGDAEEELAVPKFGYNTCRGCGTSVWCATECFPCAAQWMARHSTLAP